MFDVNYDAGKTTNTGNSAYPTDFTNIGIYAKLIFPFSDTRIYGKIGYGQVSLTNIPDGDKDRAVSGMQWGVGLDYTIEDTFTIFAEYMVLYNDVGFDYFNVDNEQKVDLITIGLIYIF
ncbi:MAG: outer membrane beta-barrel protein [Sulfurovum sp.]